MMHFLLVLPSSGVVSSCDVSLCLCFLTIQLLQSHDAPLTPFFWRSNCSKATMFFFCMFFKMFLLLMLSLMFLLFVIFVMPPLVCGFYVMFLFLLLAIQWFQATMFLLLVLPSSLVVANYDGPFAVIFVMLLLLVLPCNLVAPSYDGPLACDFCHAPLAFAFMWCSCSSS